MEPWRNWAPGAPSPRASGSALGPAPALLAPGARRAAGFQLASGRKPGPPSPHAPLGPTALPSSPPLQGNRLAQDSAFVPFSPVGPPSRSISRRGSPQNALRTGPEENRSSSLGLTFSVCTRKELAFLPLPLD